jgi:hypothetical protein
MKASGSMEVFWILGAVFVALGVYLFIYSRRRGRLMRDFAIMRGLSYAARDDDGLEQELERVLDYSIPGIARSFFRIRDIIQGAGITMFRGTELLDLTPYGKSQNTHFGRIAAYFDIGSDSDVYVTFMPDGGYRDRHPAGGNPEEAAGFAVLKTAIGEEPLSHPFSATLRGGKALLYFEPTFGSEKPDDLQQLYELAHELKQKLG